MNRQLSIAEVALGPRHVQNARSNGGFGRHVDAVPGHPILASTVASSDVVKRRVVGRPCPLRQQSQ
jgi:hypothetical protein